MGIPSLQYPKKDGHIQQITDLCSLNKAIICKQYPLSIITYMLDWISGYKFFIKLDVSMQYYTFFFFQVKNFASLSCHLANTNTNISPWDSNAPLTLPSKSWKKYYVMLTILVYILTILVPSCLHEYITSYYLTKY